MVVICCMPWGLGNAEAEPAPSRVNETIIIRSMQHRCRLELCFLDCDLAGSDSSVPQTEEEVNLHCGQLILYIALTTFATLRTRLRAPVNSLFTMAF